MLMVIVRVMDKKLKSSTFLYAAAKYSTIIITLLTTSVLARLISPAEYGVVTIVTIFLSIFTVIADMGIGNAVIQYKDLTSDEIDDIFSVSVYVSLFLSVTFALMGLPIACIYNNPVYSSIFPVASLSVFFSTINIIPNALLMREKRFKLVGKRLITISFGVGAISVWLASHGFSYHTVIAQHMLQSSLTYLWNCRSVRLRFKVRIKWASINKIKSYSVYQIFYYIINNIARNFDNLLIGKLLGNESLAYYDKGYRLMMYPVQNLTMIFNPIIHPILSDYQKDKRFIYEAYLRITRLLSLAGLLVSGICYWGAQEIILIFFGSQWHQAVPTFCILSLTVWPQMITSSAGAIYQSTGNTKLMFRSGIFHFGIVIALIVAGVFSGNLSTVACCVAVGLYLRFFIDYYFLIVRNFGYSYAGFLKTFAKDVCIAVLMGAAIAVCSPLVGTGGFFRLVIKAFIMLAVFAAGVFVTGQHRLIKALFTKRA